MMHAGHYAFDNPIRTRPEINSSDCVQCAENTVFAIEKNLEAYSKYDERFCD